MINYLLRHLDILIALEFFVTILIIFEDTGILLTHKHKSDRSKNNVIDIYFYLRAVALGLIIAISILYLNFYKNNQNRLFNKAPSAMDKQSNEFSGCKYSRKYLDIEYFCDTGFCLFHTCGIINLSEEQ